MKRIGLLLMLLALPALSLGGGDDKEKPKDDPREWTPIKILGRQQAPEFADIDSWLNSEPLKMRKLKGKVVVVNFLAFG